MTHLYGRSHEIRIFSERLRDADLGRRNVVVFYGPGGQGKTQLRTAIAEMISASEIKHPSCLLDFKIHPATAVEALYLIRVALIDGKFLERPLFDVAFREYQKKFNPTVDVLKEYPKLYVQSGAGNASSVALEIAASAAHIPFISVAEKYARKLTDHFGHETTKNHREELSVMDMWTIDEWHHQLPALLAQDISEFYSESTPPVILFDHYEHFWDSRMERGQLSVNVDEWIRIFSESLSRGVCCIFSRERLEHWPQLSYVWQDDLLQVPLSNLSENDALRMLTFGGINEKPLLEHLIPLANGHPLFLSIQIETYHAIRRSGKTPRPEDFGTLRRDVISRFVDHLDPKDGHALKVLSIPESFDRDLFEHLASAMPNLFFGLTFEDVSGYAFFKLQEDSTALMHSVMRSGLQSLCDARTKRNTHQAVFDYGNSRWQQLADSDTPRAYTLLRLAAWHRVRIDGLGYLMWLLTIPEETCSVGLQQELERARTIAQAHQMSNEELECIWRLVAYSVERELLERAIDILDSSQESTFQGRESFRAKYIVSICEDQNIPAEKKIALCKDAASRPEFLPGLHSLWKASFYRSWALAALYSKKFDEYQTNQDLAFRQLSCSAHDERELYAYLIWEKINFFLSQGRFDELRSLASEGAMRLEDALLPRSSINASKPTRMLACPLRHAFSGDASSISIDQLRAIAIRSDEQLDKRKLLPDPESEDWPPVRKTIELRQALTISMNFGIVVNARGRICLVHDQRFPTPGNLSFVLYELKTRAITIAFPDCSLCYWIDWEANDEMHGYLAKANDILVMRMHDKKPVEGYECTLVHG